MRAAVVMMTVRPVLSEIQTPEQILNKRYAGTARTTMETVLSMRAAVVVMTVRPVLSEIQTPEQILNKRYAGTARTTMGTDASMRIVMQITKF
jgi:hypothetical protein